MDIEDMKRRKEEQRLKDIESGKTQRQWLAEYRENIQKEREKWTEGPWVSEPDYHAWEAYGFKCAIMRNSSGALCGYVAVPPGHPWHGADMHHWFSDALGCDQESPLVGVEVHGGITYANPCGRVLAVDIANPWWWLGFDCAHAWDVNPGLRAMGFGGFDETYRTFEYVRNEVNNLAQQANAACTDCKMPYPGACAEHS